MAAIMIPAGPETALFATMGLTAATVAFVRARASRIPGTDRIRPILLMGLLGASNTALCLRWLDYSRRWFRLSRASEAHRVHWVLIPALHEIFLKTKFTAGRIDTGFNA